MVSSKPLHRFRIFHDIHGKKGKIFMFEVPVKPLQGRHLFSAGGAPSGPEVYEDYLPFKIAQSDKAPV